jgi:hypothetical protein
VTRVHFAQPAAPLPGHPHRLGPGFGKGGRVKDAYPIVVAQVGGTLVEQRLTSGVIIPVGPAHEALKRQALLAKTRRDGCHVLAFDVRQQATNRGVGMLRECLTAPGVDKGFHKGVQPRHPLVEDLGCNLTCCESLVLACGVSGFHGQAPWRLRSFVFNPQNMLIYNKLCHVNPGKTVEL